MADDNSTWDNKSITDLLSMRSRFNHDDLRQQWAMSPHWKLALAAWCSYYEQCETFDRRVCSIRKDDDTALPANGYEAASINDNARRVNRKISEILRDYRISDDDSKSAQKAAVRLSYKEQQIEALRLQACMDDLTESVNNE